MKCFFPFFDGSFLFFFVFCFSFRIIIFLNKKKVEGNSFLLRRMRCKRGLTSPFGSSQREPS